MKKLKLRKLNTHTVNYLVIGAMVGLILGFFAFHEDSYVDQRLRDIAEASYPEDKDKQRQALADFETSLDELYVFSENGGVDQARKDALDSEAKTDINSMHAKLESVYNSNGYYPSELLQSNLDGISYEALLDREGGFVSSEYTIENNEPINIFSGSAPQARYRYAAYDCEQQLEQTVCQHYVLFSWLESGQTYSKKSLN